MACNCMLARVCLRTQNLPSLVQVQFVDVICINRYYGWYQDQGHPEAIVMGLSYELSLWYEKHGKPMMLTEYGAGTIAGFHKVCVRSHGHYIPPPL